MPEIEVSDCGTVQIQMLSWIVYLMGTVILGLISALVLSFFMGGPGKSPERPYKLIALCLLVTVGGPFGYSEALTHLYGPKMAHAVKVAYNDAPIDGPMQYFKVTGYHGNTAEAYVVGAEHYGGMNERPVIRVSLVKEKGEWKADEYHVVLSGRLNRDEITFPPYQ